MRRQEEVLYHPEVYLPVAKVPSGVVRLTWSSHAAKAADNDRYGKIRRSHLIDLTDFSLVELGMTAGKPTKFVMRGPLDNERDVVYVLRPKVNHRGLTDYMVVTVWCNLKTDTHRTLDRSKYATQ